MNVGGNGKHNTPSQFDPEPVRDLIDFHLRWHEFRPFAVQAAAVQGLSDTQSETVDWLIKMADRIRKEDLSR